MDKIADLGDKAKTAVDMAKGLDIQRIAMIGCGSMGGGMAQLFAEKGIFVGLQDPNESIMDRVLDSAAKSGIPKDLIKKYNDYESLCKNLGSPKVFVWSLPHGGVGDKVLDGLMPFLEKGDIIIDCGNEHWENTERRQGKCVTKGIRYVGCGVSGGYQAARRGPSMCPGADDETLSLVLPTLRKVAAKDPDGKACVGRVGTGGAGHYCKMIHNGIEHGMMSAISEAYAFMRIGLGMSLDEIADTYDKWNSDGELKGTFLVWISRDICRKTNPEGQRVLDEVEDKVVQDFTGEEGTGIWSNIEAVDKHVPAPTLTTAHYLRLASGNRYQRAFIQKAFGVGDGAPNDTHTQLFPPQKLQDVSDRAAVLEDLRKAVYAACLSAYVQGMIIIDRADREYHFNVDYTELLQVWRAGCIIQADYISNTLLQPIYHSKKTKPAEINPMYEPSVAADLKKSFGSLKKIVAKSIEGDLVIPALSATLEYLKYQTSTNLPTSMYEAQLDYFGSHMYDKKGDDPEGRPETGKHHFEWKPA
ncbi:6-phosphogluconate dehydrogenase C-terminal domain-like protein [Hortaea werneckii]|nr:6-phosphogluconate dehydrogenase C-terminal domain-like protein [Hortaea werneckii]